MKLKRRGFNNLTKSLNFNIYEICYAKGRVDRKEYLAYVHEVYNSERLERILKGMADLIGARILNISSLDYRVRGFTRNIRGRKLFVDHKIHSIQQFIAADVKSGTTGWRSSFPRRISFTPRWSSRISG